MMVLLFLLFAANSLAFLAMWWDKRLARLDRRRIPENTLLLLALCGGGVGGWLGMKQFRHKTQHWRFSLGLPVIALLQIGLLAYFMI
ncbi:DUF1294 domain-containing protein [Aminivibrio sp.]|jgi:uncharacterized membrane protein YsdA (DUF1294 family)|uniref:DUF1294 domain-containing protein n=1 Tax=Aminivibrio sp. TaxID=1872489 RepID=UPI003D95B219